MIFFYLSESLIEMDFKLIVKEVVKDFKQGGTTKKILYTISFICDQKKTYALSGASGSGKSTLMHICAGLDTPTTGDVLIGGHSIFSYTYKERAKKIALVTQKPLLIKELNVLENCMLAGQAVGLSERQARMQSMHYLNQVGLSGMDTLQVGALSGGQQQRLAVARALVVKPAFLLADEPTGALDEHTGQQLITLLLDVQKKENMGLLISSHNPAVISQMEVVFALKNGILVAH
jgi:ABC-type lipoprotein export system ATPase subunit